MTARKSHPIKEKAVNTLAEKIKTSTTLMVVSIKGLPSKQFQEIKKAIREHAFVKVAKKNILRRAIEQLDEKSILPLEDYVEENSAFVISDYDGFELAGILNTKKTPVNAKTGQEAPVDIEIKAGPTDLPPGPAISELSSVGLQVAVEDGKLSIKKSRVIVKEGETITANVASILQKLHIQPFTVGLEPKAVYDVKEKKIYKDIKIDSEEARLNLISASSKSLGFAQKIAYYCKETIGYLLGKANLNAKAIEQLSPVEEAPKEEEAKAKEEATSETPAEEKAEEAPKEEEAKEESNDQLNNPEEKA